MNTSRWYLFQARQWREASAERWTFYCQTKRPNTQTLVECYNFQASEIGHDFQVVFHGTEDRSNVDSILRFLKHLAPGFVNLDRYHFKWFWNSKSNVGRVLIEERWKGFDGVLVLLGAAPPLIRLVVFLVLVNLVVHLVSSGIVGCSWQQWFWYSV